MFTTKFDLESTVRLADEQSPASQSLYKPSVKHELRVTSLVGLMGLGSRIKNARLCGLKLEIDPGVCNPAPIPGLSFSKLFSAGISDIKPHHLVLDMGTGSGVWALLAARKGATEPQATSFARRRREFRETPISTKYHARKPLLEICLTNCLSGNLIRFSSTRLSISGHQSHPLKLPTWAAKTEKL